jgi:hypothetical protein
MNKTKVTIIISIFIIFALVAAVCATVFYLASNNSLPKTNIDSTKSSKTTFSSAKGVDITINDLKSGDTISNPYTLTGEVPGNWSFEAIFPVDLVDWDGLIIASGSAVLTSDWMTDNNVPFTVTLNYETPSTNKNGTLILHKSNASGLPENDDTIEIPIKFE